MGANLARNAARNGATVSIFNRTTEKTDAFMRDYSAEGTFVPSMTLKDFCASIPAPRAIILMVKAGDAVDAMIAELLPFLTEGDILIDAGNSHYRDSDRRLRECSEQGMHFIGMGVSGGEQGALLGPSMMPGGDVEAVQTLMPLFTKMAADDGTGGKCVVPIGPGGAGHFVKMVHNGIEYGLMQLIAEAYHLLKIEGGCSNADLAKIFAQWNASGYLPSFLLEITVAIFAKKDDRTSNDLVDMILDKAGQKGTGKWKTDAAMHYGVPIPTITAGVDARIISSWKEFRMTDGNFAPPSLESAPFSTSFIDDVRCALELSFTAAYAQGLQLMSVASGEEKWNLPMAEIARIWCGGCIIRSAMLRLYQGLISHDQKVRDAMMALTSGANQQAWRRVVARGALRGIPLPAMSASLSYYDAYRSRWLPQNLIQAQRDFFGSHTYERTDVPGMFHTEWKEVGRTVGG